MAIKLYTCFHLNLAFSSIEKEDRAEVIKRCYWPLLNMAEQGIPLGLEISGYSLEAVEELDPAWVSAFKSLIASGKVELVASGYVQLIGPLVPPEVTAENLALGQKIYKKLLDCVPDIALINEQAYSPGLVPIYKHAGFNAIMMDWAEPASHHADWHPDLMKRPQRVVGEGEEIAILWSDAMSFQKFQRYAHGEISVEEYSEFLALQFAGEMVSFPLYTSDAETFDYRPGRFDSESAPTGAMEWQRIELLFKSLLGMDAVDICLPKQALSQSRETDTPLQLESAAAPIPVKKQRKYNVLRWGVTGRHDTKLNTLCWRYFEHLSVQETINEDNWRHLLALWASDYRTHITENRWEELGRSLPALLKARNERVGPSIALEVTLPAHVLVEDTGRYIHIKSNGYSLSLNRYRGLAIAAFGFLSSHDNDWLVGTLPHGFYDDIAYGADFYTGHFVHEPTAASKITDLVKVSPNAGWNSAAECLEVKATITTKLGNIEKTIAFYPKEGRVEIFYDGVLERLVSGTLRFGHITLNPDIFDPKSLAFESHNGGAELQRHALYDVEKVMTVNHGSAISGVVSANTGLGMTDGSVKFITDKHSVVVRVERSDVASLALIECAPVREKYFCRAILTAREMDETAQKPAKSVLDNFSDIRLKYSITISRR